MEYYVGLPKTTHVINQNEFSLVLLLPFFVLVWNLLLTLVWTNWMIIKTIINAVVMNDIYYFAKVTKLSVISQCYL